MAISRTKLLQTDAHQNHNQSHEVHKDIKGNSQDEADQGVFEWMEDEDVYLASANYSQELGVNLTSAPGPEMEARLPHALVSSSLAGAPERYPSRGTAWDGGQRAPEFGSHETARSLSA